MPEERERRSCRLFFALWPSDALRARIEAATHAAAHESGGRVIPARNLHVTALFLGEVPRARVADVKQAAAAMTAPAFDLTFDRLEAWSRSHVLCLTCSQTPPALDDLVGQLRSQLRAQRFRLDDEHLFRAHVTLARDLPRLSPTQLFAPLNGPVSRGIPLPVIDWPVSELVLIESKPGRDGAHYSPMERWPLQVLANGQ
jgi:2'-5' RNA ligase